MNYYVFETETVNEAQSTLVTPKDKLNDAKMLYHQILASALANQDLTYALVMLIDINGSVIQLERIDKPKQDTSKPVEPDDSESVEE